MGVDASHLIRNDFYDVENLDASKKFAEDTYRIILQKLCLPIHWDEHNFYYDDCDGYRFHIPVYDFEVFYHKGLWRIESYLHYCQIVMHIGELFWLRYAVSDIVRALGASEVWHAEEYFTWNGGPLEDVSGSFDNWYYETKLRLKAPIAEYDQDSIIKQGDVHIPEYEPVYHDTLKECNDRFNVLRTKLYAEGYELLGIAQIYLNSLRCKKNGKVVLVNAVTLQSIFPNGWYIEETLPRFLIVRRDDGLSALYAYDLSQQTEFVEGEFKWRWNKERNIEEVYNDTARIIL